MCEPVKAYDLLAYVDTLARAIKYADEKREALAWSEIGSLMERIRDKATALRATERT